jgi:Phosphatidylglycerol lysyltransferase, C-terminal
MWAHLQQIRFSINEMGTESHIDLANYNIAGPAPAKRNLRRAYNRMLGPEYTTRECQATSLNFKELETVSVEWRRTRSMKNREITFLVRPVVLEDEPDVRKFFTFDQDGHLKAFAFFDPVYEGGEVIGYLCSTRRRLPEIDPLVGYAQMRHAMESFRQEGKRYLFLGLSPLANIEDNEFTYNWRQAHLPICLRKYSCQPISLPASAAYEILCSSAKAPEANKSAPNEADDTAAKRMSSATRAEKNFELQYRSIAPLPLVKIGPRLMCVAFPLAMRIHQEAWKTTR